MKTVSVKYLGRSPGRSLYWLPNGYCTIRWMLGYAFSNDQFTPKKPYATFGDVARGGRNLLNTLAAFGADANKFNSLEHDFDLARYVSLLPAKVNEWVPGDPDLACLHTPDNLYPFPPPTLATVPFGKAFTRQGWIDFLLDHLERYGLSADRYRPMLKSPARLTQLGYQLAMAAGRRGGVESYDFNIALAIFGLGSLALIIRRICLNCFRVAVPGLRHCEIHSQAKGLQDNPTHNRARQAQRARTGRLTARAIQWPGNRPPEISGSRGPIAWAFAGLLWNYITRDENNWRAAVLSELHAAPLVRARLREDIESLTPVQLLLELRSAIDPHEWYAHVWPAKIKAAQLWFGAEASVAPGHRPTGPNIKNAERIAQANQWLEYGDSRSEVARKLGISDNHLAQILRRHS